MNRSVGISREDGQLRKPAPLPGLAGNRRLRRRLALVAVTALAGASAAVVPAAAAVAGRDNVQPNTVTEWNMTMIAGLEATAVPPPPAARIGAIVQASVFDAINGISRRFAYYHVAPAAPRGASRDAAAASAAHTALVALIPSQKPAFDRQMSATLAQISDDPSDPGPAVERGLDWGTTVANDILAWRASDGFNTVPPPYVAGTAPGDWQPTPPLFGPPLFRQFATMTPFALSSPSQFLPPGPPSLTRALYARDLTEVQEYGSADSTVRTPEQTQTAIFWQADTPTAMWDRVADRLAVASDASLSQAARQLALVNIALADATIAIWNAKNTYNFWRPITAIRASIDPAWTPLLTTPAFQEYPAGHPGVSSASAAVLAFFYGNTTAFTVTSAGLPGVQRDFASFSSAVQQVEDARVYGGIHFRFSCIVAAAIGARVASYVATTLMRPVR
ncbi:MAG: vanadium-dependent haloperoxidase [Streptosporangiaceae bacterium]